MTITLARYGIVLLSLLALAAFAPAGIRWYEHRRTPNLRYIHGFGVQHLSHLVLLVHHLIVLSMLLSLHPFSVLPMSDPTAWPGSLFGVVAGLGLGLYALGNALRIWAVFYMGASFDKSVLIKSGHRLATGGPYRLARHPIYVGNLLAELGLGMALGSWPLVVYTALLSAPVWNYRAAVEEELLAEYFGSAYGEYRAKVGRWWP